MKFFQIISTEISSFRNPLRFSSPICCLYLIALGKYFRCVLFNNQFPATQIPCQKGQNRKLIQTCEFEPKIQFNISERQNKSRPVSLIISNETLVLPFCITLLLYWDLLLEYHQMGIFVPVVHLLQTDVFSNDEIDNQCNLWLRSMCHKKFLPDPH